MRTQIIRSLAILGSLSLATANEIVSVLFPLADQQPLVGEVIGTAGSTTTYAIHCPKGTENSPECGIPPEGQTLTQADDAFAYTYSYDDYLLYQSCKYRSTTWVSCYVSNTQSGSTSVTSVTTSMDLTFLAVTITATNLAEPASTAASGTVASTTATPTATGTSSPTTSTGGDSQPGETETPNAGLPQATGIAHLMIGGAGVVLALAMA